VVKVVEETEVELQDLLKEQTHKTVKQIKVVVEVVLTMQVTNKVLVVLQQAIYKVQVVKV
jgi:hypothetical protein